MSKKFTDLSQLTKAILKKDEPQRPKPVPAHEPIPHPVKPAPAAEAPAEAPKLSREEADCLAYFSHTSIADRRFATAGRVQTPPAAGKTQEPAPEAQAELSKLMASEAHLMAQVAELRQKLEAAEARAAAAEQVLEAHTARMKSGEEQRARLEAAIRELRAKAPETPRVAPAPQPAPRRPNRPLLAHVGAFWRFLRALPKPSREKCARSSLRRCPTPARRPAKAHASAGLLSSRPCSPRTRRQANSSAGAPSFVRS